MGIGTGAALALGGATILSGAQQSKAAGKAASAQEAASRESIAAQERALERILGTTQPFRQVGQAAIDPLLEALGIERLVTPGQAVSGQVAPTQVLPDPIQRTLESPARIPTVFDSQSQQEIDQKIANLQGLIDAPRLPRSGKFSGATLKQFPIDGVGLAGESDAQLQQMIDQLVTQRQLLPSAPVQGQVQPQIQTAVSPGGQEFIPGSPANPADQVSFRLKDSALPQVKLPGAEILDNPLLKAVQEDVTQRLFANRAARGVLGAGGTADALFTSLAPTALNLGLSLQAQEQVQKQQQIQNLFNLLGLGANVAAGQGTAIQQTGQGVAGALQQAGAAQAAGALGRGQAISQGISDITGLGILGAGGFFNPSQAQTGFLRETAGFRPTVSGAPLAGPLTAAGGF